MNEIAGKPEAEEAEDAPMEAQPEQKYAVPDMIRVMGNGQIGVDDERWLNVLIPGGTPFYSEAVVAKLQDELAEARELATSFRQAAELPPAAADNSVPGVNMKGFLMGLPVGTLLDLAQGALNHLTMRQLSNVCYDAGITPSFQLVDRHG